MAELEVQRATNKAGIREEFLQSIVMPSLLASIVIASHSILQSSIRDIGRLPATDDDHTYI